MATRKMELIKIGKRFYDDHCERALPAPSVIKSTKSHYWIDASSDFVIDLLEDADFYSIVSDWPHEYFGLCISAARTADAIRKHQQAA